jgi:tetratricopeptide (TPR) repeat protein
MTPNGDDTRLGRQFDPYFEFFNGNLDDLWVFSGTLTAGEVASLAVGGSRERAYAVYLGKDYAEAERLFLTMAGAAQQAIPPKTVNIIQALCLAARSAQKLEEFIRAREHLAKAEKLTDRQRNPAEWAEGRAILAKNLWYQQRNAEAETLLRELISAREKALGARVYLLKNNVSSRYDELDTLTPLQCRTLFANTLRDQGKYAEAEAEYKEVIQLEENVLGPEHRDTLNACYNLAYQLGQEGKREQAKALAERAAKSAANVLGVNDPHTREYAKFLEELESGHAITLPAVEFRKISVSGENVVEQGPR